MDQYEVRTELDQIALRLQEDGLAPGSSAEEQQLHLWHQLVQSEGDLRSVTRDLQTHRTQQASEMKEVENYVEHIRGLLEEREALTAEYERDNEQLRLDLQQLRLQQESQGKELVEMLAQEGLGEIGLSSPSELVAYLLVERATLLERLEAAERRLDTHSLTDNVHLQKELDHVCNNMEELRQQRETMQRTDENMIKCPSHSPWKKLFGLHKSPHRKLNGVPIHNEAMLQERLKYQRLERDLEEASRRLTMAHEDIRRLTSELDVSRNNQGFSGFQLEQTGQEMENLRKEVDKLKHSDMMELQKSREQNGRLDGEIRVLRERVRTLDSEKKHLFEMVKKESSSVKEEDSKNYGGGDEPQKTQSAFLADEEHIHKKCREAAEDQQVQARELQRRIHRVQQEQEELVERNEELEALLGEIQNNSKAERQQQEGELEGQLRKIKSLEAELKLYAQGRTLRDGDISRETDTNYQQLRGRSYERMALLEARLTEEKDWRKQLEMDLSAAQAALKKNKEALQIGERELQKLKIEFASLQTECQQGKTLIKSLTQVKGEKGILEEKVAQLERSQSRLENELEHKRENNWAQEDLRESRTQVEQLKDQLNRFTAELDSLQKEHSTLRDDMSSERRRTIELQAQLSLRVQEKLAADGDKERLGLELHCLRQKLQLSSRQELHPQTGPKDHCPALAERTKDDAINQWELSCLQNTLAEERQLASQHQLALQAQLNEAHSRTKSQDSLLGQKTEEGKQLKQDLQRAQSLFTSAEKELRYEREKNLDLKRHNTLLEQEKLKLSAELKLVQSKLLQAEQSAQGHAAECERQRHNLRELELELARSTTSNATNTNLQEELCAERASLVAADKKVLDLQQQLKNVQHQLSLADARAGESSRMERDNRDVSDTLAALRSQQQGEHITRKLLEQREEELQQQVRSLRLKEATLARTNSELSHHAQQVETRLATLEAESSKTREEKRELQRLCHRVQEELVSSQQDSGRLQEELQKVITQLDVNIRKYNEKQSQHKIKLGQAKQLFLKTMSQRDNTIQKLENDLALASSLSHKEKDWIRTVTEENEKLLVEKTELLNRMSEAEEKCRNSMRIASTLQHKIKVLELENQQLQERTLKLSNQVGSLERALRDVQSFCRLEQDVRTMFPTENPSNNCFLQSPTMTLTSDLRGTLGILDTLCRVKVSEGRIAESTRASLSTSHTQPTELGYLNLTSPLVPPDTKGLKES